MSLNLTTVKDIGSINLWIALFQGKHPEQVENHDFRVVSAVASEIARHLAERNYPGWNELTIKEFAGQGELLDSVFRDYPDLLSRRDEVQAVIADILSNPLVKNSSI